VSRGVVEKAVERPAAATAPSQAEAGRLAAIAEILGRVGLRHATLTLRTPTMTDDNMAIAAAGAVVIPVLRKVDRL
jgi:hypothetical protein